MVRLKYFKRREAERAEQREHREILDAVREALEQLKQANQAFENASEPELVEACVYEIKAIQARYAFCLRMAREKGANDLELFRLPKRVYNA